MKNRWIPIRCLLRSQNFFRGKLRRINSRIPQPQINLHELHVQLREELQCGLSYPSVEQGILRLQKDIEHYLFRFEDLADAEPERNHVPVIFQVESSNRRRSKIRTASHLEEKEGLNSQHCRIVSVIVSAY